MKNLELLLNDFFKLRLKDEVVDKITILSFYIFFVFVMIFDFLAPIFQSLEIEGKILNTIVYLIIFMVYIFVSNIKNKRIKFKFDFYLVSIFLIMCIISTLVSSNPFKCLIGDVTRNEGLFTYILYYLIYLNSKVITNKNTIVKFINVCLLIGIIQTIVAFVQVYTTGNLIILKGFIHMGYGISGNPNFYGTLTMYLSLLGLCLCLFYEKHTKFHIISTIIIYIGLILSQSSGPFFSFCLTLIIIFLLILLKKKKLDNYIIWLSIFVFLYAGINYSLIYVNKHIYKYDVPSTSTISGDINSITQLFIDRTINIKGDKKVVVSNIKAKEIGNNRFNIWKNTLRHSKDNVWFGEGPDNLLFGIMVGNSEEGHVLLVDKAHNTYLNTYATTGILSLIINLIWIFYVTIKGFKSKDKFILILLIGFVGYNIQGFTNINVIEVMPYYFIITGMMMGLIDNKKVKKN